MKFARIHIVVGILCLIACSAFAGELPFATGNGWSTSGYFTLDAVAPGPIDFSFTNCQGFGPLPKVTLVPGGAAKSEPFICGQSSFGTLPVPLGVSGMSKLTYDDKVHRASFSVPPLSPFRSSGRVLVEGGASWVTILCNVGTPLTATVYDGANPSVYTFEYFECTPPASVYGIQARGVNTARISIGYEAVMSFPDLPMVYGFVTSTDAEGFGNGAAEPLR